MIRTFGAATLALILGLGSGTGFASYSSAASAAPLSTVTAAVIGVSSSIWPAIVAEQKGFFAEQGLDVQIISSGSSARSLQEVAAGAADIGSSSMVDSVRAIDRGGQVEVFLNSQAVGTHSLIAAKNVKSVMDLRGKRVMTGGQKDITNLWWYAMAKHDGLDHPGQDVQLLFSGSTANRLAALLTGGVEATVLSPPQSFKAIQLGYTDLGAIAPYLGPFPMMIWHVNDAWAKGHVKELVAFTRAHNKAVRYLLDPANKLEVCKILAKASNSSLDDVEKTWDLSIKVNAYVPDGGIAAPVAQRVIDVLTANGDMKKPAKPISAFYTDQFVRAAAK
jgi:NitT/TauT family transport system substrate-binding protein